KSQPRDGVLQQLLALFGNLAMLPEELWRHLSVGVNLLLAGKALQLQAAGAQDALAHGGRFLDGVLAAKLPVLHRGDLNVDIDAVEQGSRDSRDVALDLRRRAMAFARGVAKETARARVHRRGEHKARGKGDRGGGARNGHRAFLERLAHHLEDVALNSG